MLLNSSISRTNVARTGIVIISIARTNLIITGVVRADVVRGKVSRADVARSKSVEKYFALGQCNRRHMAAAVARPNDRLSVVFLSHLLFSLDLLQTINFSNYIYF